MRGPWSIGLLIGWVTLTGCEAPSSGPVGPSTVVQFSLTGTVSSESSVLPASRVEVVSGVNAGQATTTEPDGRYRFTGLTAGQFVVRASASGYQPQTTGVTLDADKTANFMLPQSDAPAQNASLSGQVTVASETDDGAGLAAAQVTVTSGASLGRSATTDEQGRYTIPDLVSDAVTVEASAPGYLAQSIELQLAGHATADFRLTRSTTAPGQIALAGVITEVGGSPNTGIPVPMARVVVSSGPQSGRSVTADEQGRYRLENLLPGPLTLEASATGFLPQTRSLTLEAGLTVDFQLMRVANAIAAEGRVIDVLSRTGLSDVALSGPGVTPISSGVDGTFRVTATSGTPGARRLDLSSPDMVARRTYIQLPGAQPLDLSLIPVGFNLTAFDQMLRTTALRRWVVAPPLLIERRAVEFTDVNMTEARAGTGAMSEDDAQSLLADLRWALPQLTGGTFADFNGVAWHTAEPAATVRLLNSGFITVVRVVGLADATGAWGWSRWLFGTNGVVVGGLVMLDEAFDRSDGPYRRSLRAHELGHALGYAHVQAIASVMNADGRREPTAFDLTATRIAFDRPPGNRTPDIDPEQVHTIQHAEAPVWSDAVR